MGREDFHGLMEKPMRVNTSKTKKRDMESSHGLMEDNLKVIGKMEGNMALESL